MILDLTSPNLQTVGEVESFAQLGYSSKKRRGRIIGSAAVLKTADRKVMQVRVLSPPPFLSTTYLTAIGCFDLPRWQRPSMVGSRRFNYQVRVRGTGFLGTSTIQKHHSLNALGSAIAK